MSSHGSRANETIPGRTTSQETQPARPPWRHYDDGSRPPHPRGEDRQRTSSVSDVLRRRNCRARGPRSMICPQHLACFARRRVRRRLVPTPAHGSDRLRPGRHPPISVQLVLGHPDLVLAHRWAGSRTRSSHSVLGLPRLVSLSRRRVRRRLVSAVAQRADPLRVHPELAIAGCSMLDRGVHVRRLEPQHHPLQVACTRSVAMSREQAGRPTQQRSSSLEPEPSDQSMTWGATLSRSCWRLRSCCSSRSSSPPIS